jgi:hypothetical protein
MQNGNAEICHDYKQKRQLVHQAAVFVCKNQFEKNPLRKETETVLFLKATFKSYGYN